MAPDREQRFRTGVPPAPRIEWNAARPLSGLRSTSNRNRGKAHGATRPNQGESNMQRTKRLLIAGGLAASVLAGGTLFSARPAAADDWDHPLRRLVRVLLDDGRYVNRYYYYDYTS